MRNRRRLDRDGVGRDGVFRQDYEPMGRTLMTFRGWEAPATVERARGGGVLITWENRGLTVSLSLSSMNARDFAEEIIATLDHSDKVRSRAIRIRTKP